MASSQICVSSFHFAAATANCYLDVASQSLLARQTGGQVYLYTEVTGPTRDVWAVRLEAELGRNLRRSFGYEGVMRVRTSKGLMLEEYLTGEPCPGQQVSGGRPFHHVQPEWPLFPPRPTCPPPPTDQPPTMPPAQHRR